MVGYVFYVDRFAGRLKDVATHIPYLTDLGVTYAHMMPLLKPRPGLSDGGYAVMDYREIDPRLGTMADFRRLAQKFRTAGISPCIDLVLNHTAREHPWAEAARAGDPHYRAFYRIFDTPETPQAYERTLVEVFPDQAPGNFTRYEGLGWVWTTFNEFQWDLNWENPEVFLAILDTILHLANQGVEVFRLDAVAFMWKRMGTNCQNLPEVHDILQALVQATRIAAPAVIHKAEAIVAPRDLVPYLGSGRHTGREAQACLSQLADGAVLVGPRRPRHPAHDPCIGPPFPADPAPRAVRHLPALPRRHRLGRHRGGRRDRGRHDRAGPPGLSRRFLRRAVPRLLRPRRGFPGQRGNRRPAHQRHAGLPRRARERDGPRRLGGGQPRHRAHPDGPCPDRQLRRHAAHLHGRRAGP